MHACLVHASCKHASATHSHSCAVYTLRVTIAGMACPSCQAMQQPKLGFSEQVPDIASIEGHLRHLPQQEKLAKLERMAKLRHLMTFSVRHLMTFSVRL